MALNGGLSVGDITTVTGSGVRVRESPVSGATLYSAGKGNSVKIMENGKRACSDGYYWYLIGNRTLGNKPDGWIRGDFLAGSEGTSSGGETPSIPGVKGNGPNSIVSATDIREGRGVWKKDTATSNHPHIKIMQSIVSNFVTTEFPSSYNPLTIDGCFGDNTRIALKCYQSYRVNPTIVSDGVVGPNTLMHLERSYGGTLD